MSRPRTGKNPSQARKAVALTQNLGPRWLTEDKMYIEPYAWRQSDIKLQCSFCGHAAQVEKGKPIPQELEMFTSRGWRYLGCPRCLNGFLKIYVKTQSGKWRFKSKTLYTEAINWRTYGERGSEDSPSS